jgi:hypothetical protein
MYGELSENYRRSIRIIGEFRRIIGELSANYRRIIGELVTWLGLYSTTDCTNCIAVLTIDIDRFGCTDTWVGELKPEN